MNPGLKRKTALWIIGSLFLLFTLDLTGQEVHHCQGLDGIDISLPGPVGDSHPCCQDESPVDHYMQHGAISIAPGDEKITAKNYTRHIEIISLPPVITAGPVMVYASSSDLFPRHDSPWSGNRLHRAPPAS